MESLVVLDVFCTYSECATTSTSKFSKMSIFIIFWIFFFKNVWKNGQNFDEEFFGMSSWSFFGGKQFRSLSKTFLGRYLVELFYTHYFFWKLSKSGIWRSAFIDVEFFGMSSYDPKSSSIEKFEKFWIFFICITSSYLL